MKKILFEGCGTAIITPFDENGINFKVFKDLIEYSLKLDSNPEFTSSVLVCYARALYKMYKEGITGAKTVFDIPPVYLSNKSNIDLLHDLL